MAAVAALVLLSFEVHLAQAHSHDSQETTAKYRNPLRRGWKYCNPHAWHHKYQNRV